MIIPSEIPIKKIYGDILRLAIPASLANIISTFSGLLGVMIIAKLGAHALAASALIFSTYSVLMMLVYAFIIAMSILISQSLGAREVHKVVDIFQQTLAMLFIFALPILFLMRNMEWVLLLFKQSPSLATSVGQYYAGVSYGFLPMLITFAINSLLLCMNAAKINLGFTVFNCLLNLVLTYIFVLGHASFPAYGIAGAGYAVTISYITLLVMQLLYLNCNSVFKAYHLFHFSLKKDYVGAILKLGIPICVQRTAEQIALLMLTLFIGWISHAALMAQQINMQVTMLFLVIPFGFLQSISILVGKAVGEGNIQLIKRYTMHINIVTTLLTLLLALICWLLPDAIIHEFIPKDSTPDLIQLTSQLLAITAISQLIDNVRNTTTGALRGLSDSKLPMYYSLFCLWIIAIPAAYILAFIFKLNAMGVNLGFLCGIVAGSFLVINRFRYVIKRYAI